MKWIWTNEALPIRNAYVRFRKTFQWDGASDPELKITADSRYSLFLNGEWLGFGPVRNDPAHWQYDVYQIAPFLRRGKNVLAVLVNHFGEGNFQYLAAPPGLALSLELSDGKKIFESDASWKASPSRAYASYVPRISVQEGYEESFDARLEDDWKDLAYDDSSWANAAPVPASHPNLRPRDIPFLTAEKVFPTRVLQAETVRPPRHSFVVDIRHYFAPGDLGSNHFCFKGFLFTQIWSPKNVNVLVSRPHHHGDEMRLGSGTIPKLPAGDYGEPPNQKVALKAGWNPLLVPMHRSHVAQFSLTIVSDETLRFACRAEAGGSEWAYVGPFAFTQKEMDDIHAHMDFPRVVYSKNISKSATAEERERIWNGMPTLDFIQKDFFQEIRKEDIFKTHVFGLAYAEEKCGKTGDAKIEKPEALLSDNAEWATLHPAPRRGDDVRLLLDFGKEIIGFHVFEVDAEPGLILDFHNFEFIQADGRHNLANGMNNSFRYICKGGRERFQSRERRGFQYSWLIARNMTRPLRIREVSVLFSTYPQTHAGSFTSSDEMLNTIWKVGAHTLRLCAEDTYTDCPSYEQTHWVGDARNEALVDWVVNGDHRLWFHCLLQTGQSLERLPITISQAASAWDNLLPAWSFLWMRSCREYLLWTGDEKGARELLVWVKRNVDGVEKFLNDKNLFEFQGWNMFDWAAMDTPSRGVITHNNCFCVLALEECAELSKWLGDKPAESRFKKLAASMKKSINRYLWDDKKKAYVDSIHHDGVVSKVFSQQTQTAALLSGVAEGARAKRARDVIHRPPKNFVKAGSPFFEFFLLEVLAGEGREKEFLDTIRKDWGFMIEQGASTFWEMWSGRHGRLTRSHCHGWSAAPTFFLSSTVLGVKPLKPGFAEISFDPKPGDLRFIRGTIPTPRGPIEVSVEHQGKKLVKTIRVPKGVKIRK